VHSCDEPHLLGPKVLSTPLPQKKTKKEEMQRGGPKSFTYLSN